jgi:hypothetical protein
MARYSRRGSPTTIVIDRDGTIREHAFGQVDDLALGALVGLLAATPPRAVAHAQDVQEAPADCAGGTCPAPVDIPR